MSQANQTSVTRVMNAPPAAVYAAFLDHNAIAAWLPPDAMTGEVHAFEAREGGAFSMSLHYPEGAASPGKTSQGTDTFKGRFVELVPDERIVWAVVFESADSAFAGEMTVTTTLAPAAGGTSVTMLCEDIPPGIRAEDNEAGCRSTLDKLAAYLSG